MVALRFYSYPILLWGKPPEGLAAKTIGVRGVFSKLLCQDIELQRKRNYLGGQSLQRDKRKILRSQKSVVRIMAWVQISSRHCLNFETPALLITEVAWVQIGCLGLDHETMNGANDLGLGIGIWALGPVPTRRW